MADSINNALKKSAPATRLFLFITAGLIALAGIAFVAYLMLAGDEQPIRVRNGSMDLEIMEESPSGGTWIPSTTVSWEDVSGGDFWRQSGNRRGSGEFYVKVIELGVGDTCDNLADSWKTVAISYSDGVKILFIPGTKTMVRGGDKTDLQRVTPPLLRHGPQNDGRITGVQVSGPGGNRSCTFATTQPEIHVCSTVSDYCK